ncbi:MAG: bifunctional nuclease family protein [Meiothermus sp.]|uniref:bifunctional nuclease family protein n=1 Tax=Meiothermus sp. TaxID=1955249 RepID=UPI0025CD78F2|nr:bifunctional nuclease family protein [Meiothermus sp.]MCS7067224.1 bifunctional nuclease family protein [Meiothermus sp.]MCX7600622.1 bifunctional nuclease family protein [Meiothermus sp.]MDW8426026.1 bifunctional nuclease family protein [Meiothermus sp.]
MVPARIEGMGVDPGNGNLIVMLRAENNLFLPVVIGALETQNIMIHLSGEKPPRPLGPDLFYNTLELLGVKVLRLEIVELKEGTFYGRLVLEQRGLEYEIDCRPSDGMALAIRANAPILIAEDVLKVAGVSEAQINRQGGTPKA